MRPLRAISSTAGCLERGAAWGVGLLFAGVGVRLLTLAPDHSPAWPTVGMAVACLLTALLAVRGWALGRSARLLALLWFGYLTGYLVAVALLLPR